jgi:DNA uptake protein ComE-like DNA-binding protein
MAVLQQQQSQHEDELLTRDVEIAVHKRMYEKAVGIIAAMRAEPDLPERPKYQKVETKPTEDQPPVEKKLVDVNTASFTVLRGMGLTNNLILQVINGRPYKAVEDLKNTPGMSSRMYNLIEPQICCIPVEQEPPVQEETQPTPKVNINTCQAKDLIHLGMDKNRVYKITSDRKKNGAFLTVGDLTRVVGIGQKWLDEWIDKLEV